MLFEWDHLKSERNIKKHGISFELAQTVFEDPLHLASLDSKKQNEERWITIGRSADDNTLIVVHTYCIELKGVEHIRIISARQATRKEKKQYEEGI